MIKNSSYIRFRMWCAPIVCLTLGAPIALSQPPTGSLSTPNYLIFSDKLFAVNPGKQINLAKDKNFLLEDITPCLMADQFSPMYSCTEAERHGSANALQAVYPQTVCSEDVPGPPPQLATLTCAKIAEGITVKGNVVQFQHLVIRSDKPTLLGGRLYRFTYWTSKTDSGKVSSSPNTVAIDTRPIITAIVQPKFRGINQITLSSAIAFAQKTTHLKSSATNCSETLHGAPGAWGPVKLKYGGTGLGTDLQGEVRVLEQDQNDYMNDPKPKQGPNDHVNDPTEFVGYMSQMGVAFVCVDTALQDPFPPTSDAANNVIQGAAPAGSGPVTSPLIPGECADQRDPLLCAQGKPTTWLFAQGTKLSAPSSQPSGKSDAHFYANLNMVAATGSKFAWGLDGKLAELQRPFIGNSSITWLSATANVGNNTSSIKSQTYSDSIDWTLPISYDWRKVPLTFSFAPDYSTDIEFDRKNMLADIHMAWIPRYKRLAWNTDAESGADAKYSSINIKPGFGEQLYLQAGIETGGALIDTTQKASTGSAKITVPAYNIVRVVPQIHGVLEWKPIKNAGIGVFSFDDTFTGRYLLETENTVEQYVIPGSPPAVGLLLRPISGWKAYNSFVTNWYPPRSSNVAVGITYNDGFNPPRFSRVNSVLIGLTIVY